MDGTEFDRFFVLLATFIDFYVEYHSNPQKAQLKKDICDALDSEFGSLSSVYFMDDFAQIRDYYATFFINMLQTCGVQIESQTPFPIMFEKYGIGVPYHNRLGMGQFGEVIQGSTRTAVKKVQLERKTKSKVQFEKSISKALEEVRILARLHHPNVVRYWNSWLEKPEPPTPNIDMILEFEAENKAHITTEMNNSQPENNEAKEPSEEISWVVLTSRPNSVNAGTKGNCSKTLHSWDAKRFLHSPESRDQRSYLTDAENLSSLPNAEVSSSQNKEEPHWNNKAPNCCLTLFIEMELCDKSLETHLKSRPGIDDESFVHSFKNQMLSALDYIHSHRIVHADIKPANIFINEFDGQRIFKLGDFGLAFEGNGKERWRGGTPGYAAPELATSKNPGPEIDIYSLGIVLFELCNDYHHREREKDMLTTRRKVPPPMQELFPKMTKFVLEMTERDPKARKPTRPEIKKEFLEETNVINREDSTESDYLITNFTKVEDGQKFHLIFASLLLSLYPNLEGFQVIAYPDVPDLFVALDNKGILPLDYLSKRFTESREHLHFVFRCISGFNVTCRLNVEFENIDKIIDLGHSWIYKVKSLTDGQEYTVRRRNDGYESYIFRTYYRFDHPNVFRSHCIWRETWKEIDSRQSHLISFPEEEDYFSVPISNDEKFTWCLNSPGDLHFQMQSFSRTLNEYLAERETIDEVFNLQLCSQLLSLCEYASIRKEGVLTIQTDNIFLQEIDEGTIFLIDLEAPAHEMVVTQFGSSKLHKEMPVSFEVCSRFEIYLVGLVLFEVYNMFKTDEEKIEAIRHFDEMSELPPDMELRYPQVVDLIFKMTYIDPRVRPTAENALRIVRKLENDFEVEAIEKNFSLFLGWTSA